MHRKTTLFALALLVVSGLTLAACDDAEQGRIRSFEPGKYQGKADTELSEQQREALRRRATGQSGG